MKSHAHIRVVGAGHSFSPLAKTDEVLLNLDQFKGVVAFDQEKTQCTVQAGTRLYDLGKDLTPINQALINQGDIDQQSLAGAISTGTHGTGIDLPCISAFVEGFELLTADGELLQCHRAAEYRRYFRLDGWHWAAWVYRPKSPCKIGHDIN